ncbi:putative UPF0157 protein YqkA [Bisporella sp. PMI_857]|nr:putative UPF0157 protein YqkA [Bisporella sp. PMI_857]
MSVIIEPHNPQWLTEFARVKGDLQKILGDIPIISIEHIGSTSVPGLLAKPILDIAIIIPRSSLAPATSALVAAGYVSRGELGVPDRYAFRKPPSTITEMKRNTYVVIEGCQSMRNHLTLKKMLTERDDLRNEYAEVKRRLIAGGVKDVDEYCVGKTDVILKILREAGWDEKELGELETLNR